MSVALVRRGTAAASRRRTSNASGIPLPTDNVSGWSLVLADDFDSSFSVGAVNGATGAFPSPYAARFSAFVDGTADTANNTDQPPGSVGIWQPSETLSVSGSTLNVHAFLSGGVPRTASWVVMNPTSGWGQTYGRYQICFRVVNPHAGWKTAFLLWPDSESWPNDGEIDFPEGEVNTGQMSANMHHSGDATDDYDHFDSGVLYGDDVWHVATIEWAAGFVRFTLEDDRVVGTSWATIPGDDMHWVVQTETNYPSTQPTTPTSDTVLIEVDWVAMWELDTFTAPSPAKTATLVDTFTTLDRFVWVTPNGTHGSGQVSIPQNTSYTGSLNSVERFDLTSSTFHARVTPDTVNASSSNWMLLSDTNVAPSQSASRNELSFNKEGSNLVLGYRTGGTLNSTSITYNSTDHAWWRFEDNGTSVLWRTSPDGSTWTTRRTVTRATVGWTADEVQAQFGCGYWDTGGGTPNPMTVDNVNA